MEKQHLLCDFPSAGLGDRGAHQITRGAFYLPKTREVLLHLREPPFARGVRAPALAAAADPPPGEPSTGCAEARPYTSGRLPF
jgi:hypothetical protein